MEMTKKNPANDEKLPRTPGYLMKTNPQRLRPLMIDDVN
jgi:hypothetical protein